MRKPALLFLACFFLFSCGMEKRLYRPGYYFHSGSHLYNKAETSTLREDALEESISPNREKSFSPDVLSLSPSPPEVQQPGSGTVSPEKSPASCDLPLPLSRDTSTAKHKKNVHSTDNTSHHENFKDDVFLLFVILIEIAGIALFAWLATLIFPAISIWLAIVIGLVAFYALLVILYLIFARNEV